MTPLITETVIIVPVVALIAEVEFKHAFVVLRIAERDVLDVSNLSSKWAFCSDYLPKPMQPGLFGILESESQSQINPLPAGIVLIMQ